MDEVFPAAVRPGARGRRGERAIPLPQVRLFFPQDERAVGGVLDAEVEGVGQQVDKALGVVGAEAAADAQLGERRIGDRRSGCSVHAANLSK